MVRAPACCPLPPAPAGPSRMPAQGSAPVFSCKPFQEVLCVSRTNTSQAHQPMGETGAPHNQEGDKKSLSEHARPPGSGCQGPSRWWDLGQGAEASHSCFTSSGKWDCNQGSCKTMHSHARTARSMSCTQAPCECGVDGSSLGTRGPSSQRRTPAQEGHGKPFQLYPDMWLRSVAVPPSPQKSL